MEEVKETMKAAVTKKLLLYHLINTKLIPDTPTPAQVKRFYRTHLAYNPPEIEATVTVLHLTLYPKEHKDLSSLLQHLETLYHTISQLNNTQEKTQQLKAAIKHHYNNYSEGYVVRGGYLSNTQGEPQISIQNLPPSIKEAFLSQKQQDDIKAGLLSPPHIFTDEAGRKAVRIILFKRLIATHHVDPNDDYHLLAHVVLEENRKTQFKQWYDNHKKLIVFYPS